MDFSEWTRRHPQAAKELDDILKATPWPCYGDEEAKSEAAVQQHVRMKVAQYGAFSWRNNVGALPAKSRHKCPKCNFKFEETRIPVRYGLANDSEILNKKIKSSDLILAIPRLITPEMVGKKIAQFGAIEVKNSDWCFTGTEDELAQKKWLALITRIGGFAAFSTGGVELNGKTI